MRFDIVEKWWINLYDNVEPAKEKVDYAKAYQKAYRKTEKFKAYLKAYYHRKKAIKEGEGI